MISSIITVEQSCDCSNNVDNDAVNFDASSAEESCDSPDNVENDTLNFDASLQSLNCTLCSLDLSPIKKHNILRTKKYPSEKLARASRALKKSFDSIVKVESDTIGELNVTDETGIEMINQLKEKFETCKNADEKLRILSVLPKSWSVQKVQSM